MAGVLDQAIDNVSGGTDKARRIANGVSVVVGPKRVLFEGWESIRISRSIDTISGSFSISFADKWRQFFFQWDLVPGLEILINIGPNTVLRGYIDRLDASVSNDSRTLEVSGRDLTGDLVDSSAPTEPSEYKLVTIAQLAAIFVTPFAIPFAIDVSPGAPFEKFTVKQGESVFDLLHRAAKSRSLILQSTEIGGLLITNRSSALSQIRSPAPLVQGQNILEASASYDYTDRFATYTVKGQGQPNDLTNRKLTSQVVGVSTDPVMATRPGRRKTIIADSSVDFISAQQRADNEAINRAARSCDVSIKVQGWRQDVLQLGPLWRVNQLVIVQCPLIGIQGQEMLVRSVQFNKSISEGTTTTLGLTRSDAYQPNQTIVNPAADPTLTLGWAFSALNEVL